MEVRPAIEQDWATIWPFFRAIVAAGETYAYDRDMPQDEARRTWMVPPPGHVAVAVDDLGAVIGSASMYRNRGGGGAHVASASFMVDPGSAGRGAGRALGEYFLAWAREAGFRAAQFNAVVASNERAVALWRSLGFVALAAVPAAFEHPTQGEVPLLIMHRFL